LSCLAKALTRYREKKWLRWTIDALAMLALVLGVSAFQARNNLRDVPLPQLHLTALDGALVDAKIFKGHKFHIRAVGITDSTRETRFHIVALM
jgi:hypothetical protein